MLPARMFEEKLIGKKPQKPPQDVAQKINN